MVIQNKELLILCHKIRATGPWRSTDTCQADRKSSHVLKRWKIVFYKLLIKVASGHSQKRTAGHCVISYFKNTIRSYDQRLFFSYFCVNKPEQAIELHSSASQTFLQYYKFYENRNVDFKNWKKLRI